MVEPKVIVPDVPVFQKLLAQTPCEAEPDAVEVPLILILPDVLVTAVILRVLLTPMQLPDPAPGDVPAIVIFPLPLDIVPVKLTPLEFPVGVLAVDPINVIAPVPALLPPPPILIP